MTNCEILVDGDIMTIVVDLSQEHRPSKTGKTTIIASTGGNKALESHPDIYVGLNVFKKD